MQFKYDKNSAHAQEFINDEEIRETLLYAENNKDNKELIESLLEKARPKELDVDGCREIHAQGLNHR